jgi:MFS family permease
MAAFSGFLFLITLYLQEVRGYRPLVAGLFLLPMAVAMAVSAPLCGRLLARSGPRTPLLIAGTGITVGGLMLVFITGASPVWYVLLSCLVLGIGMGWVNAPITNSAVAGMPRARAGTAAGIASTSRQVGSSLGVAVVGSVLAANLHGSFATGFASATRPAWWLVAIMGAVVLALALATTGRAGQASAARTAELIESGDSRVPASAGAAAGSAV